MELDDHIGAEIVGAQAFPISMRHAPDRNSGTASRSDIVERIAHHADAGCLDPQRARKWSARSFVPLDKLV
jgi:hypothetical protein